ncbi:MAG: DNA-3-methyladenine glycosylase 2 family protein [Methanosarcinales archaeon]|nr:DNA-3-methyladenine glycosylase 2 family protein [Methanosarcinales archaeon]
MHIRTNDFDLDSTLDCGQVFRWQRSDKWWTGVVRGHIVRARQDGGDLVVDTDLDRDSIVRYFRLDDDMPGIYSRINIDPVMDRLIKRFRGLRLIRQEPWECLISYMSSSNNSIPNIKNSISNLSRQYGYDLGGDFSFPTADVLARTSESRLRETKLGFRSGNILEVAKKVVIGELDLEAPFELEYGEARELLMGMRGIGPKIADCVLLFAYDKTEAFPVDTHILSVMEEHYGSFLKGAKSKRGEAIGEFARSYFGHYAGYAQQYLFNSRISNYDPLTHSADCTITK